MDDIIITTASEETDFDQILELQLINHKSNISHEQALKEGFVTVRHTKDVLKAICKPYGHVIAKKDNKVVGYALVMMPDHTSIIPELEMMGQVLAKLNYLDKPVLDYRFMIMGQICVAAEVRGKGVFDRMYEYMKNYLKVDFDIIVTEIAERNQKSMKAHQRCGFTVFHTYLEEEIDELWNMVVLNTSIS
jgi:hypothetical protein